MTGRNIGDLLIGQGRHLGLVPGRLQADRQQGRQGGLRRQIQEHPGQAGHGLQPPSRALPILPGDRQSPSSAAELGGDDRQGRSGEASIRPQRFLRRSGPGPSAGCQLRQGEEVSGCPCRIQLLEPDRRAEPSRQRSINAVEKSPYWQDTAIIIAYDDSDGWYDHVMPPILKGSAIPKIDALNGDGQMRQCGPRRLSRPLRLWPAPAAARHLALSRG